MEQIELLEVSEQQKFLCIPKSITKSEMQEFLTGVTQELSMQTNIDEVFWLVECLEGAQWLSFSVKYDTNELSDTTSPMEVISFTWDGTPIATEKDKTYVLSFNFMLLENRFKESDKEFQKIALQALRNCLEKE